MKQGKLLLSKIVQENASQKSVRYWTDGQNTALSCIITRPRLSGDSSVLVCPKTDIEDSHPILHKEVQTAVKSLKKGKSAGVDNILAELVQAGREVVITTLMTICKKIWHAGQWQILWTQSLVITLLKKGNLQQCQNYRTISLIRHPSKDHPDQIEAASREDHWWRTGRLQSRKEYHRTDFQSENPLWEISPAPARPLPCFHTLQEGLHKGLAISKKYNISANLLQVIKHLYDKASSAVLFNGSIGDWF